MELDNNQRAFFALLQAGLWERDVLLEESAPIDFIEIYQLAEEQSVVGLVTAGFEHTIDVKVPKEITLTFVGNSLQLEQRNLAMNAFVADLIGRLRGKDIYAILVKGQGLAQCYKRPLWRASGDVDLFLSNDNYQKAVHLLTPIASDVGFEITSKKHISFLINGWEVELHGTLSSGLWRSVDRALDNVQYSVFHEGRVRSWMNGDTQVFLPGPDEDVVFVFAHILQHFFRGGIGLRQICDWCRLLWTYKSQIDLSVLEGRLQAMGVMSEWKAFAALAINYIGMPEDAMPFYSSGKKWNRKAERVLDFVIETGNFGHNRDNSYYKKYPFLVFKTISFFRHCRDIWRYFLIFPLDAIKVWWHMVTLGLELTIKGKSHE